MSFMVMLIIDEVDRCPDIFDAWEAIGIKGITILESTGLGRLRKLSGYRDDMPLMPSLSKLLQAREEHHRTIFTVTRSEEKVDQIIEATQRILGDLSQPNVGVIFVLPVLRAVGVAEWNDERA